MDLPFYNIYIVMMHHRDPLSHRITKSTVIQLYLFCLCLRKSTYIYLEDTLNYLHKLLVIWDNELSIFLYKCIRFKEYSIFIYLVPL